MKKTATNISPLKGQQNRRDPTPEEIAAECKKIREENMRERQGLTGTHWNDEPRLPRVYKVGKAR